MRRRVRRAQRGAGEHPQRLPAAGLGHPGRQHRAGDPEAAARAATSRTGCWSGAGGPRRRWSRSWRLSYLLGVSTRRMEKLVETLGITRLSKSQVSRDGQGPRRAGRGVPHPAAGRRARTRSSPPTRWCSRSARAGRTVNVHALLATGVNAEGYREILGLHVYLRRGRRRLAGVLPRPDRPRPDRGRAGHLRRAPRAGRSHRRHPARRDLAAVPHPLRGEPDVGDPEVRVGLGEGAAALASTTSPTPTRCTPSSTVSSTP